MRKFRRFIRPQQAHPVVMFLFDEMHKQQCGPADMQDRSGVCKATMRGWRTRNGAQVQNVEACLNVLGYTLTVGRLPDDA